jgi:SAM-dependent methyltransferase
LSRTALDEALVEGATELAEAAGASLTAIAYPHGRADERVADHARRAGWASGWSTAPRALTGADDDLLLPRLDVTGEDLPTLAARITVALLTALPSIRGGRHRQRARRPGEPMIAAVAGQSPGSRSRAVALAFARRTVPPRWQPVVRRLVRWPPVWPPVGLVRFGSLRTTVPFSRSFGFERGQPIDRFYIERFLRRQSGVGDYVTGDIRGRVLEIGESVYARRFGGWDPDRPTGPVTSVDVLDPSPGHPEATVVADLADAPHLPSDAYDCIICTQTLLLIYDVRAAMRTLHRILAPGGVLLLTVPGISQICQPDMALWGDHWRFTSLGVRRLAEEAFAAHDVTVETHGNVLAAAAFLYGLAASELRREELEAHDPDYQLLITLRAVKSPGPGARSAA